MDNKSQKTVVTAIVIILLLLLSGILFFQGRNNKKELKNEKQSSQSLFENNDKLKKELIALQDELNKNNLHVAELIKEKEQKIDENNAKIQRLISENKSGIEAKRQIKEIESQNNKLQSEIEAFKEQLESLTSQSQDQSEKISGLEKDNILLKEQNNLLRSMISNNIKITATKGKKNKLTVMAARTNLISAQLDVPASASNSVNFVLVFPDGTKISSKDVTTATINVFDPSADKEIEGNGDGYTGTIKSLELRYTPKTKLKKGIYKLSVYNENDYITGVYIGLK